MLFRLLLLCALALAHVNGGKCWDYGNHRLYCARLRGGGRFDSSGVGIIQASEAEKLRQQGILKGKWAIESQEEPESDIQDAYPSNWPEEWGGLEETDEVTRMGPGPLRLYLDNKYNRDVLPTGEVSQATLDRLKDSLVDENGYTEVEIEENSSYGTAYDREVNKAAAHDGPNLSMQSVGDQDQVVAERLMTSKTSPQELNGFELPSGVTPGLAKKWLSEAIMNPFHREKDSAASSAIPDFDGDGEQSPEITAAERAIDDAIANNDTEALEAAIEHLKKLKDK
uniref:Uncharacterized protein n=1 Tax=Guillardia theta TaxID=55529 RepID=A0A7S4KLP8_GUITH|mmetsp:Transcript_26870/g.87934  ORF Transcript_26870/g.87934 Transcript_26870/m.87934 type:complete len:283 (+) Transcript_26870:82-930(+)